jgi:hypothetical protein
MSTALAKREFGSLIKQSYSPHYDDVDDLQLANDTIDAYPYLGGRPDLWPVVSSRIHELATTPVEEVYFWPFHSAEKKARDRQANTAANLAQLRFLAEAVDTLEAARLGISVSVLPQAQLMMLQNQFNVFFSQLQHRMSMETLEQTARLTKLLEGSKNNNTMALERSRVQNEMDRLWDETNRKFETLKRVLEHQMNDAIQQIRIQGLQRER